MSREDTSLIDSRESGKTRVKDDKNGSCFVSFLFLLLCLNFGYDYYLRLQMTSLETSLEDVQKRVDAQQVIVDRFNNSVTNQDVLDQLYGLKVQLDQSMSNLDNKLAATEGKVHDELDQTVKVLDQTVATAENQISAQVAQVKADVNNYVVYTNNQFSQENNFLIYQLAGTFTLLGSLISMWHMTSHLRNFHQAEVQRKILAILWMSPLYGVTSWLSLVFTSAEGYLSIIRDCYEAYAIYTFLSFLISVLGRGDRDKTIEVLAGQGAEHLPQPVRLCCGKRPDQSALQTASTVLVQCQLFTMQFVFIKPMTSISSFVLAHFYDMPMTNSDYTSPQFYIFLVENISIFIAFSGLIKFYHAVEEELKWCKPLPKFLCIKGVVFMTFWQGLAIGLLAESTSAGGFGESAKDASSSVSTTVDPSEWATMAQNFLICLEMLLFAIAHFYVFPTEEWRPGYRPTVSKTKFLDNLALRDFFKDVKLLVGGNRSPSTKNDLLHKLEDLEANLEDAVDAMSGEGYLETVKESPNESDEKGLLTTETTRLLAAANESQDYMTDVTNDLVLNGHISEEPRTPPYVSLSPRREDFVRGVKKEQNESLSSSPIIETPKDELEGEVSSSKHEDFFHITKDEQMEGLRSMLQKEDADCKSADKLEEEKVEDVSYISAEARLEGNESELGGSVPRQCDKVSSSSLTLEDVSDEKPQQLSNGLQIITSIDEISHDSADTPPPPLEFTSRDSTHVRDGFEKASPMRTTTTSNSVSNVHESKIRGHTMDCNPNEDCDIDQKNESNYDDSLLPSPPLATSPILNVSLPTEIITTGVDCWMDVNVPEQLLSPEYMTASTLGEDNDIAVNQKYEGDGSTLSLPPSTIPPILSSEQMVDSEIGLNQKREGDFFLLPPPPSTSPPIPIRSSSTGEKLNVSEQMARKENVAGGDIDLDKNSEGDGSLIQPPPSTTHLIPNMPSPMGVKLCHSSDLTNMNTPEQKTLEETVTHSDFDANHKCEVDSSLLPPPPSEVPPIPNLFTRTGVHGSLIDLNAPEGMSPRENVTDTLCDDIDISHNRKNERDE